MAVVPPGERRRKLRTCIIDGPKEKHSSGKKALVSGFHGAL